MACLLSGLLVVFTFLAGARLADFAPAFVSKRGTPTPEAGGAFAAVSAEAGRAFAAALAGSHLATPAASEPAPPMGAEPATALLAAGTLGRLVVLGVLRLAVIGFPSNRGEPIAVPAPAERVAAAGSRPLAEAPCLVAAAALFILFSNASARSAELLFSNASRRSAGLSASGSSPASFKEDRGGEATDLAAAAADVFSACAALEKEAWLRAGGAGALPELRSTWA